MEVSSTAAEGPAVPILVTHDMSVTLAFFKRLGFETERYDDDYAFVRRHAIELHYSLAPDSDPFTNDCAAYIPVTDVDQVHQEFADKGVWLASLRTPLVLGIELRRKWDAGETIARISAVEDKPWGIREFALFDPTNNLLRFGQRRRSA